MSNQISYKSLAPRGDIELNEYTSALDYALSTESIHNVAIAGAYGSGKSSILKTYEKQNSDKLFLHISLAHFDEPLRHVDSSAEADSSNTLLRILEGKILNQLLHQIDPKRIPQSRFPIKKAFSNGRVFLQTIILMVFSLSLLYVLLFNKWRAFITNTMERDYGVWAFTLSPNMRIFATILLVAIVTGFLYHILRTHANLFKLPRKINVKDINIELFEQEQDFSFDKYLNEVLYLFEQCGADAVVFEDLDRYEITQIFGKIREISDLMWQRFPMRKEACAFEYQKEYLAAPPKFFYLLKDDVFTSSDRSKFFDFIIPVIPVADASNSADMLKSTLKEVGLESKISDHLLEDISLYLGDMRLLTNIVNEYRLYCLRLDASGIKRNPDMQLAMIIYKNLFPEDFILLQQGQGYVYHMLEGKAVLVQVQKTQIDDEIEELRAQIEDAHREILNQVEELNVLFFPEAGEIFSIDNTRVRDGISRKDAIAKLLQATTGSIYHWASPHNVTVSNLIAEMEDNPEYRKRKLAIENNNAWKIRQLQHKISMLEAKLAQLEGLPFRELIRRINSANFDWKCEIPTCEIEDPEKYLSSIIGSKYFGLLRYFVINGYISEDYPVYISVFYSDMQSASDKRFLLALKSGEAFPFDYALIQPDKVLSSINDTDYMLDSIDNFDLFVQLLRMNQSTQIAHWFNCAKRRAESSEHPIDFIIEFWKTNREKATLIHKLNQYCPEWFETWISEEFFELPDERQAILDVLYCCNSEELKRFNRDSWLTDRISSDESFLQIDKPDIPKIIRGLINLNVRFEHIISRQQDSLLVKKVYESSLYELNIDMIHKWMWERLRAPEKQIEQKSYTLLSQHPNEPLTQYVEQELETYLTAITTASDSRFIDDEDYVLKLINRDGLSESLIHEYFLRSDTVISQITNIANTSLWELAIQQKTVKCTGENIARYYALRQDTDTNLRSELIEFINDNKGKIEWTYNTITTWIGDEGRSNLLSALTCCNELRSDRYRACLKPIGFHYNSFSFANLSDEHIDILIELGIIFITKDSLSFMRNNYPNHVVDCIAGSHFNNYLQLAESGEITIQSNELVGLLCLPTITDDAKSRLMACYNSALSPNTEYSTAVNTAIIQNYLAESAIPALIETYDQFDIPVQNAIIHYAEDHLPLFLKQLTKGKKVSEKLYAALLPILDEASAKQILKYINNPDFSAVCNSLSRPSFDDTVENETILRYFKEHGWISSYTKKSNGSLRAYPKKHMQPSALTAMKSDPKHLI